MTIMINATGRAILMSIRPVYAHAILDERKTVEFRKRRLATNVTHVVIYSTAPDQTVIGCFTVKGQETATPAALWERFHDRGVIGESDFFTYYSGRNQAVAIEVGEVIRLHRPLSLTADLGVSRPPQSYQYLTHDQLMKALAAA